MLVNSSKQLQKKNQFSWRALQRKLLFAVTKMGHVVWQMSSRQIILKQKQFNNINDVSNPLPNVEAHL